LTLLLRVSLVQCFDVDLLHFEHGFHDPFRFLGIWLTEQLTQPGGNDLPGQTIFVFQPAALTFLSTAREFVPILVYFLLRFAIDGKRYGLTEFEVGTTV